MKIKIASKWVGSALVAAALMAFSSMNSRAQGLMELEATQAAASNLNSQSVSSGPGNLALDRAKNLNNPNGPAAPNAPAPTTPPATGAPAPSATPGAATPAAPGGAAILGMTGPQITVISGTRVFDAVSGILLDDAIQKKVPQSESDKFFDDGTHGDLEAGDGEYTKVDERRDMLGSSNQRFKEQLVKALVVADSFTPLEYFGLPITSTERSNAAPRNRAWSLVPDPNGGVGFTFRQVPVTEPVTLPNYRDKQKEKDANLKNNWAQRFLQEFRVNKDDLTSQFFSLYIPQPPSLPTVPPPALGAWSPFSDPQALTRAQELERTNMMNPNRNMPNMGGGPTGGGGGGGGGMVE